MKHILFAGGIALSTPAAFAETKDFDVKPFDALHVSTGLQVEVTEGEAFYVRAEGKSRGLKRLDVTQSGDTLRLSQSEKGLARFSPFLKMQDASITVYVTLPELTALKVSSGSYVSAEDSFASTFSAQVSSGSEVDLEGVTSDEITVDVSSGSSATLEGECDQLTAEASSGAKLYAKGLECDAADARASSGSSISIHAGQVDARASSGGDIDVYGATEVSAETSSGGHVARHD